MNNLDWEKFVVYVSDYVGVYASEIGRDTDVYEDLCLDSLGLFGLGDFITDTYKLNVPLSSVAMVCKVGDIFDILNEQGKPSED